jgi:hypothetical protein
MQKNVLLREWDAPSGLKIFLIYQKTQRVALGWYGDAPSGRPTTPLQLLRQTLGFIFSDTFRRLLAVHIPIERGALFRTQLSLFLLRCEGLCPGVSFSALNGVDYVQDFSTIS